MSRWTFLIDLSGTLHIEDIAIPGAASALSRLRTISRCHPPNILFVTNTTKESTRCLLNRLLSLSFNVKKEEIFSSLSAAHRFLSSSNLRPMLLLDPSALEDFTSLDQSNPNSVLIGLAPTEFEYEKLNSAFRLLLKGARLIGVHKGRYYKRTDGLALGPGPFIQALEYATDTKAEIIGKPSKEFFFEALKVFQDYSLEKCVMIGDDVKDDIEGAQRVGLKGVLVRTGKYRDGDEDRIEPKPWLVLDSFTHAVEYFEGIIKD